MKKQIKLDVSLYWLLNHLIHYNDHKLLIFDSKEPYEKDFFICEWDDLYYQDHKEELYPRIVSFMVIVEDRIKVYLKEE